MPQSQTCESLAAQAAALSPADQQQLAQKLLTQAAGQAEPPRRKWSEIRGSAPYPLCGEDAQEWVSRSRREDDESSHATLQEEAS